MNNELLFSTLHSSVGLGCLCIALRISHLEVLQYSVIWVPHHLRLLAGILNIRQTMVSHAVGRGHAYASCFCNPILPLERRLCQCRFSITSLIHSQFTGTRAPKISCTLGQNVHLNVRDAHLDEALRVCGLVGNSISA